MNKTLNKAQIALLNALSTMNSEKDFQDFQDRIDQEMDKLWEEGKWNDEFLQSL
ncbi:MAG: hypothetical protein LIP03_05040 [Bacteroidales bacterium]|nr:hypothetical protein [Bacteroidales bacterium]